MVWDYDTGATATVISSLANATATITPHGGLPFPLDVIFDQQYVESGGITGDRPTVAALTGDLTNVNTDAHVLVNGIEYRVAIVQPDGTGITTLVLELQ